MYGQYIFLAPEGLGPQGNFQNKQSSERNDKRIKVKLRE